MKCSLKNFSIWNTTSMNVRAFQTYTSYSHQYVTYFMLHELNLQNRMKHFPRQSFYLFPQKSISRRRDHSTYYVLCIPRFSWPRNDRPIKLLSNLMMFLLEFSATLALDCLVGVLVTNKLINWLNCGGSIHFFSRYEFRIIYMFSSPSGINTRIFKRIRNIFRKLSITNNR